MAVDVCAKPMPSPIKKIMFLTEVVVSTGCGVVEHAAALKRLSSNSGVDVFIIYFLMCFGAAFFGSL